MKTLKILLITAVWLPLAALGQNFEKATLKAPLKGRAYLAQGQIIAPGQEVEVIVDLNLHEGFYAYEKKLKLRILEPEGVHLDDLKIDPIVTFVDVVSKKTKTGFKGQGSLRNQIIIPKDVSTALTRMLVEIEYVACTAKFCLLPKKLNLVVPVTVKVADKSAVAGVTDADNFASNVALYIEKNFLLALLLIFFFGFLTSFTPCVYPLIPITLAVLGANKGRSKGHSFLMSLCYVVGIAITYALLGVVAAQTGQLFGSLLSHPIVIIFMSVLLLAMGLSLFGLFELQAPGFLRDRTQSVGTKGGFIGAFLSGTIAGIVASPCVGPVLVGLLAYIAQTQNSSLGFLLLFTFAMGFGLLFLVLGTFSQLTSKLPRSGSWMNGVKYVLGAMLIGLSLYYAWPLIQKSLPKTETTKVSKKSIAWQKFSAEKVVQAKAEGRPVIIDFYADWCVSCVEMDELTFVKESVVKRSKSFMMLKVDATEDFEGLKEIQNQYEVFGLPTMIFIDKNGNVVKEQTLTGFEKAELFIKRMDGVSEETQVHTD